MTKAASSGEMPQIQLPSTHWRERTAVDYRSRQTEVNGASGRGGYIVTRGEPGVGLGPTTERGVYFPARR